MRFAVSSRFSRSSRFCAPSRISTVPPPVPLMYRARSRSWTRDAEALSCDAEPFRVQLQIALDRLQLGVRAVERVLRLLGSTLDRLDLVEDRLRLPLLGVNRRIGGRRGGDNAEPDRRRRQQSQQRRGL